MLSAKSHRQPCSLWEWRRHPESNQGITALRAAALSLGYAALIERRWIRVALNLQKAKRFKALSEYKYGSLNHHCNDALFNIGVWLSIRPG